MLVDPEEAQLWKRYFDKRAPGDKVTHQLLSMIGSMMENALYTGPCNTDWFFWVPQDEAEDDGAAVVRNLILRDLPDA